MPQKLIEYPMTLGIESIKEIVKNIAKQRPTAVIVVDDRMAYRLIEFLREHPHLQVPETISVVSFHRSPIVDGRHLKLSTVEFDFF